MKKAFYLILAGVAVGILIAPRKGSETWQKLKDSFDDWKEDTADQMNDFIMQGKQMAGKGKSMANTLHNEAAKEIHEW